MLARVAEALYWTARNLEHAAHVLRALEVPRGRRGERATSTD